MLPDKKREIEIEANLFYFALDFEMLDIPDKGAVKPFAIVYRCVTRCTPSSDSQYISSASLTAFLT